MRLINADVLIEDLEYELDLDLRLLDDMSCVGLTRTLTEQAVEFKRYIIKQLKNSAPVKGEWLRGDAYPHHIYCSKCFKTYIPNDEWDMWKFNDNLSLPRNFCPNCGAPMKGEKNDQ